MAIVIQPDPCLLVIFGASGDLTQRKLIPSLYELYCDGYLPEPFAVLGVSRSDLGDDGFRARMREEISDHHQFDEAKWGKFEGMLFYEAANATDVEAFGVVKERVASLQAAEGLSSNVLFYLSMAPQFYEPIINHIGTHKMVTEGQQWCSLNRDRRSWQRIIVEKPFGHDLKSAEHLNRVLGRVFDEQATFRIDHYLGKETVQNLVVFRFGNLFFEPLWNRQYIDHIQITAAETVGVEGRGGYFEKSGAMRDMIQSHLLQVMATVAMEAPNSMMAHDLRAEQGKVLQAVRDIPIGEVPESAVRGQYAAGEIDGKAYIDYIAEDGVAPDSNTETYAALRLHIDNWRWHGVPFYLRTGKGMNRKLTQIVIYFKPTPHSMFRDPETGESSLTHNRLTINVQPDEGISLRFEGKVPGPGLDVQSAVMDFDFLQQFGGHVPEAYGHLLLDAMQGDRSLFKDRYEIEAAWRIAMPVLDYWAALPGEGMHQYEAGSWGPEAAGDLFHGGAHWHNPDGDSTRFNRRKDDE